MRLDRVRWGAERCCDNDGVGAWSAVLKKKAPNAGTFSPYSASLRRSISSVRVKPHLGGVGGVLSGAAAIVQN